MMMCPNISSSPGSPSPLLLIGLKCIVVRSTLNSFSEIADRTLIDEWFKVNMKWQLRQSFLPYCVNLSETHLEGIRPTDWMVVVCYWLISCEWQVIAPPSSSEKRRQAERERFKMTRNMNFKKVCAGINHLL